MTACGGGVCVYTVHEGWMGKTGAALECASVRLRESFVAMGTGHAASLGGAGCTQRGRGEAGGREPYVRLRESFVAMGTATPLP